MLLGLISRMLTAGFETDPTFGDQTLQFARDRLDEGDYQPARECLAAAKKGHWNRDHVFSVLATGSDVSMQALDDWTDRHPGEADGWTFKGHNAVRWAWEARTGAMAEHVGKDQWASFFQRLEYANQYLEQAIDLAPRDAMPYACMLFADRGLQRDEDETLKHFGKAYRRDPSSKLAHDGMHGYLQQKWFGSHDKMFRFAKSRAKDNPVFNGLIAVSHVEMWLYLEDFDKDYDTAAKYFERGDVAGEIQQSFDRFLRAADAEPQHMSYYNCFAWCLWRIKDGQRLQRALHVIGDNTTDLPWCYQLIPAKAFKSAQKLAARA